MNDWSKWVRFALWVALAAGCGSVTAATPDGGRGGQGGGSAGAGAADVGDANPDGAGDGPGGAAPVAGMGGAGAGAGGAPCTPAIVQHTAGPVTCNCGGTCAPCPVADGPTCGGGGLGHLDWQACTVNGAPYYGCAAPPDGGALGYCCANNCSQALCELQPGK